MTTEQNQNSLDVLETMNDWFAGIPNAAHADTGTWEDFSLQLVAQGKDPEVFKNNLILAATNQARSNANVEVSSSTGRTTVNDIPDSPAPDTSTGDTTVTSETETLETDTPDLTNATEAERKAAGNYVIQDENTQLVFQTQADGTVKVTDIVTGESGIYSTSGPTGSVLDGFLLSGTPNGHVLWNNRDLTGYRQTAESSPGAMDYDSAFKTTEAEAIEAAVAKLPPNATNEEKAVAIQNATAAWRANPYGGGAAENPIYGSGGGGGIPAPQLKPPPVFKDQAAWDKNIYDSLGVGTKAMMSGGRLPALNPRVPTELQSYFGGNAYMPLGTLQDYQGFTQKDIGNYDLMANNFNQLPFNEQYRQAQRAWGGNRQSSPSAMNVASRPSFAPQPLNNRRISSSRTPFGFNSGSSPRFKSYTSPSRNKSASIRSGRAGMVRGNNV